MFFVKQKIRSWPRKIVGLHLFGDEREEERMPTMGWREIKYLRYSCACELRDRIEGDVVCSNLQYFSYCHQYCSWGNNESK
jgi:hypothetical protein